jgi:hypothetical protein
VAEFPFTLGGIVCEQDHFVPAGQRVVPNMRGQLHLRTDLSERVGIDGSVAQRTSFRLVMDASLAARGIISRRLTLGDDNDRGGPYTEPSKI